MIGAALSIVAPSVASTIDLFGGMLTLGTVNGRSHVLVAFDGTPGGTVEAHATPYGATCRTLREMGAHRIARRLASSSPPRGGAFLVVIHATSASRDANVAAELFTLRPGDDGMPVCTSPGGSA